MPNVIEGTNRGELLRGTEGEDDIFGLGGNDTIRGLGGNDGLWSGRGDDLFIGGAGRDRIDYRNDPGAILFDFGRGRARDGWGDTDRFREVERVVGSQFNDTMRGTDGFESFSGEGGDDLIIGGGGGDFVWYGRSEAAVVVDLAAETARGEGNDTLRAIDNVGGSNFGDRLRGNARDNFFSPDATGDRYTPNFEQGGADTIDGRGGFDMVSFETSLGSVRGSLATGRFHDGNGNIDRLVRIEAVRGSAQDDRLSGNALRNGLYGDGGDDRLSGGGRRDTLDGGAGDDRLNGGSGRDVLTGGAGADQFRFVSPAQAGDRITDFTSGEDRIVLFVAGFGGGLERGALDEAAFDVQRSKAATTADERVIYRASDATLWFDADGRGGADPVLLARLQEGATITAGDIFLL